MAVQQLILFKAKWNFNQINLTFSSTIYYQNIAASSLNDKFLENDTSPTPLILQNPP